jgi:hypothetical protein
MYFKPPTGKNPANPFYHRSIEEQRRAMQEAVTVEMEFKTDADGAAVVGSETKSKGMLISGQKVRNKVYRLTFKNNNMMNQFMKTYDNKLNEEKEMDPRKHVSRSKKNPDMFCVFDKDGNEVKLFKNKSDAEEYAMKNHDALMESTPEYRRMMKRYKGSDNEKVFNMLRAKGYKVGEQDDTLVQNLLKRHRGNVKKVVDQIVKDYPGKFDVERMMMDHVEIDEAEVYKRPAKISALGGQKNHAIVDSKGNIIHIGMSEKDAKKIKQFGQKVMELPGARVGQRIKEGVEQVDEMSAKQHYNKMVAQGKVGRGGRLVTPIDRDRFPNREKEGLEGPFRSRKSGQVYYYDKKAGKYYDPLSDMFLQVKDVMENTATYDVNDYISEEND